MTGVEILDRFRELGVDVELVGEQVQDSPLSKVPGGLWDEAKAHEEEIVRELRPAYGDGQIPPEGRPPSNEIELRRLIDALADPEFFAAWMERIMEATDPAERSGRTIDAGVEPAR